MNEQPDPTNTPPRIPPQIDARGGSPKVDDYRAMQDGYGIFSTFESLLKHPLRVAFEFRNAGWRVLLLSVLAIAISSMMIYGMVVGTFTGGGQVWIAPTKMVFGILASAVICLPSLYIFACLGGVEARVSEVAGFFASAVALSAVLLVGFAPVAWIFSESTESIVFMGSLHLLFWVIGLYFGLRFLFHALRRLENGDLNHVRVWAIIFVLVTLQMTTALRPIIGKSDTLLPKEKKFFLQHWGEQLK